MENIKVNKNKDELLKAQEEEIKLLKQELSEIKSLEKKVEEGEVVQKKNRKIDVRTWLITSSFAICSCIFGLINLILNLVKR